MLDLTILVAVVAGVLGYVAGFEFGYYKATRTYSRFLKIVVNAESRILQQWRERVLDANDVDGSSK